MRQTWRWLAIVMLVVAVAACHRTPDEQQVRNAIAAATEAANASDAGAFAEVLTDDFEGNDGEYDRRRLSGLLRVMRLRQEKVSVVLGPVDIERRGARIVATFTATVGGGGRILPDQLGVFSVETAWRQDGGDWRCYHGTWKQKL